MADGPQTSIARMGSSNRWFVLTVLGMVAVLNYIDRTILSILQVPIKKELGLTDGQLGALTGLAFALFYTTLALPIARLADRKTRKIVIALSLLMWSGMTALTGLATGFVTLVILRIGVAIGEAGSVPATHSMISDLFPRERRATALSAWGLSYPVGTMLGLAGGGWLAANIGWRDAFLWIGLIGIVATPLLLAAIREPVRGRFDPPALATDTIPSAREALALLWSLRCFRYAVAAGALNAYVQYAMLSWNAPFYSRAFGMSLSSIAGWLALMNGIGGGIGIYLSGNLSDWLGRRFTRGYLTAPAVGMVLLGPLGVIQYMFASQAVSLAIGMVTSLLVMLYFSCIVSVSHSLIPPRMRAFTSAVIVLVVNLVGVGLGPLVTGLTSDWLGSSNSDGESLRWALTFAMIPALFSGWLYWKAASALVTELPAAHRREADRCEA